MHKIGITMGYEKGIGAEIIAKALLKAPKKQIYILIGNAPTLISNINKYSPLLTPKIKLINDSSQANNAQYLYIISPDTTPKQSQSYCWVEYATKLAIQNKIDALVTAPINKKEWANYQHAFTGHTELIANFCQSTNQAMAFYSQDLKVILTTIHLPLNQVSSKLTIENVFHKIQLANDFLKQLGLKSPKIAVCGLNPHAGEQGVLGKEEIEIIDPAVKNAQDLGINVQGSLPADTVFYRALHKEFDMVVAMYHDQALAPLKLIHFHDAVNITLGLPIIRTSPDHGTAENIFDKNLANPSSILEAIKLAIRLCK